MEGRVEEVRQILQNKLQTLPVVKDFKLLPKQRLGELQIQLQLPDPIVHAIATQFEDDVVLGLYLHPKLHYRHLFVPVSPPKPGRYFNALIYSALLHGLNTPEELLPLIPVLGRAKKNLTDQELQAFHYVYLYQTSTLARVNTELQFVRLEAAELSEKHQDVSEATRLYREIVTWFDANNHVLADDTDPTVPLTHQRALRGLGRTAAQLNNWKEAELALVTALGRSRDRIGALMATWRALSQIYGKAGEKFSAKYNWAVLSGLVARYPSLAPLKSLRLVVQHAPSGAVVFGHVERHRAWVVDWLNEGTPLVVHDTWSETEDLGFWTCEECHEFKGLTIGCDACEKIKQENRINALFSGEF
jgi:hypothetical protein